MSRSPRRILVLTILLTAVFAFGQNQNSIPTQHNEMTVAQLQAQMASGQLTSETLTRKYIARILALDQKGPSVNSVIKINPDALAMARAANMLRGRGIVLGPL